MRPEYLTLTTKELKNIVESPKSLSSDGFNYSDTKREVKKEYLARIEIGAIDRPSYLVMIKQHKDEVSEADPVRLELINRLKKARACRTKKPPHMIKKVISVSITVSDQEYLNLVGKGNTSKGIAKAIALCREQEEDMYS